ncbi:MAG: anti-sigma factor family protein [Candidatus Methylomirabilales bacterium]
MACDVYRDKLIEYLDGELIVAMRADLEAHLDKCAGCRAELRDLRETLSLIAQIPAPEPSEAFWQQYLREIRQKAERVPWWTSALRRWFVTLVLRPIPAVVVAAVLVLGAVVTWRTLTERPTMPELGSLDLTHQLLVTQDLEVLQEMELLEDWELLEEWELIRSRAIEGSRRAA